MSVVKLTAKEVSSLVNTATANTLGGAATVTEDLQGVVDVGTAIANANAYENYLYNMLIATAKIIFVERRYTSKAPNVYRDQFEYGQLVQKIRAELDKAEPNQSWQLTEGTSYDDDVFVGGTVNAKLFMNAVAWEIRKSITNDQIKSSFTNAQELGNFVSMIFTMIQNSIQVKLDSLIMMVICNFAGEVLNTNNSVRAVNLLAGYKSLHPSSALTPADAIYDADFLKYATGIIKKYQGKLENYSTLFNEAGTQVHTPKSLQHLVLLEEFADNCDTYLASSTFHDEFVKLPYHETVSFWEGQGTDSSLGETSRIKITTASNHSVDKQYVMCVLFDHDALGVTQDMPSVETKYVRSGQFTNYWFKQHTMYFNDLDENFIVFYLGE